MMNSVEFQFEREKWTDNLKYAAIIQKSLLPKKRHLDRIASDHALLYKPLEYVSGDFYWTAKRDIFEFIAVEIVPGMVCLRRCFHYLY